jgi:hypothetical protein
MLGDLADIGNGNHHNPESEKIVFPNRFKDYSFSVDKPDEGRRRTRSGFFSLGRTEVGVKRRARPWLEPARHF